MIKMPLHGEAQQPAIFHRYFCIAIIVCWKQARYTLQLHSQLTTHETRITFQLQLRDIRVIKVWTLMYALLGQDDVITCLPMSASLTIKSYFYMILKNR